MRILQYPIFCFAALVLFVSIPEAIGQANAPESNLSGWDEEADGPLPHFPVGGIPEPDPDQPLHPYVLYNTSASPPGSGLIESPPEYGPSAGMLFRYSTTAWAQVVTDCVAAITSDPTKDDKAYVVVASAYHQNAATTQFTAAGADMSKVEFILLPSDSIWLRDYGPAYILLDGAHAIVDAHYYILGRTQDNFIPTQVAEDHFQIPSFHLGLNTSAGGNFLPGPNRSAFVSAMIYQYNSTFPQQYVIDLYQKYLGIDGLHVFPQLPTSVDLTGHIDMWMYVIDDDTVVISEFIPGSDPTAMQITENAVVYMQNLGFEVFRIPDHVGPGPYGGTHYTYTNGFRLNDRLFIPSYAGGDPAHQQRDDDALAAYQAAAPNCQIIQIPCYDIIWAAGAIHCISMNVPLRTVDQPAAHLLSPDGGELLVSDTTHEIEWCACDDSGIAGIDLYYSIDGGTTFPHLIASGLSNDSQEPWTVPALSAPADQGVVKVVANDGTGNSGEDLCEAIFEIRNALQTVYDFSSGGGVDRWGFGPQTYGWYQLDGIRYPSTVNREITKYDPLAYDKLGVSDATGGDTDPNRYISQKPGTAQESTHIFDFTIQEDPELILDIGILWEGYGDGCSHMEVYLWDNTGSNWSNGDGMLGENRYMTNHASNRDDVLEGHIRADFDRYIDGAGRLSVLIYAEYTQQKSFHDYIAVTVTHEYTLAADAGTISQSMGGVVNFSLNAGTANAGRSYFLLGSASGTEPGLPLPGGATLPLNWDVFTGFVFKFANTSYFSSFQATLDGSGTGTATFDTQGPLPPAAVGAVLHFAYLLYGPFDFVSNPAGIEIVP